jgi:gas vesicle protein
MREIERGTSSAAIFVAGTVAGAAIGALAGVLLAPRAGREIREQLSEMAEDLAERTRRAAEKTRSSTEAAIKQARGRMLDGQELADRELHAAKAAFSAGRDAWRGAHNGSSAG